MFCAAALLVTALMPSCDHNELVCPLTLEPPADPRFFDPKRFFRKHKLNERIKELEAAAREEASSEAPAPAPAPSPKKKGFRKGFLK